jgi:hypothetical protein
LHATRMLAGSDSLQFEWRPWPRKKKADRIPSSDTPTEGDRDGA